jgi:hypothetical protein
MSEFASLQMVLLGAAHREFTLTYPNIAHDYWDHFRLTGDAQVRRAKAPSIGM